MPGNEENSRIKIYKLNFMARGSMYWWELRMVMWALPGNDGKKTQEYIRQMWKIMKEFCQSLGLEHELAFRLPVPDGEVDLKLMHWGRLVEEHSVSCLGLVIWLVHCGALSRPKTERPVFITTLRVVCDLVISDQVLALSLVFVEGQLQERRDYGMKYNDGEEVHVNVSLGKAPSMLTSVATDYPQDSL